MLTPAARVDGRDPRPARGPRFAALLITQVSFGMAFSTFFLLPKYLAQALGADDVTIGGVGAAGALAGVVAFPVAGVLSDRYGRLRFVLLGNLIMTACALSMLLLADAGPWLYVVRMLMGLAFAFSFNSTTTLATDDSPREALGRVLALFGTALLATNALAPALAEEIAALAGWRAVFWVAASFGAVSALLAALSLSESTRPRTQTAGHGTLLALLSQRRSRRVLLAVAAAGGGFGTIFTFHQPFALRLGIQRVAHIFLAYATCAVLVRFFAIGRLERSSGRQRVSAVSLFAYALAVAATAWLKPGMLAPIGALMGLAHGVFYPVCNALAIESVSMSERGSMMALYHGGFNCGFALAALIGGGVATAFGYPSLFLAAGGSIAAISVLLWCSDLEVQAKESAPR